MEEPCSLVSMMWEGRGDKSEAENIVIILIILSLITQGKVLKDNSKNRYKVSDKQMCDND
jgi:hypothetical protein